MTQTSITQEHVQGFRSVRKSEPHSVTSLPLDTPNITHIDCYTDPDTNRDFILWEEIQQVFDEALFVRNKTKMLPFVRGKDYRVLEPRRIAAAPDVVLDVVVSDQPIAATDTAAADTIASLQLTVQELLLKASSQTSIESTIYTPSCGNRPKHTQVDNHIGNLENTPLPRGPQASENHSQDDNNSNATDTQPSDASNNATKQKNDLQDEIAARNMTLMQTMINASQGDVQAQVALGDRYLGGRELHQDYDAAFDWYFKAAEQNHPRAQYNIGLLFEEYDWEQDEEEGDTEEGDIEEGDIEEGDIEEGDIEEGDIEEGENVVLTNRTKAFEWFLKAAVQGYDDAQAKVSQAYTDGAGVPKDNIKAMEWSIKAAENGHAERQYYMGAAYEKGHGVPQSNSRSFEWYLKSADQGFAEAEARVASAFKDGWSVSQDDAKAVEWYTKAADQDVAVAQFALGRIYNLGLCGLPKDRSKAVDWFIKAALEGHTQAQFMLREIYDLSTSNSHPDFGLELGTQPKIKEWFLNAADQGVAHAQVCMANMYSIGCGVYMDDFKAFQWLLKAAEQGDDEAQSRVAYRYEIGLGVTKSREKSVEWLLRLAKRGNEWAEHHLKVMTEK
ncbi:hypothetical protein BGZ88_007391 [Linnemannia elongata]|nr:hypothetical protein BGZ88_007391 [Linnemannia elongata]